MQLQDTTSTTTPARVSSSLLNAAYRTLADPLHRAEYILSTQLPDCDGDTSASLDGATGCQRLLLEVLELREAVEEAATEGDREAMRGLWRENEERCRREEEFVGRALEEGRWINRYNSILLSQNCF